MNILFLLYYKLVLSGSSGFFKSKWKTSREGLTVPVSMLGFSGFRKKTFQGLPVFSLKLRLACV